MFARYSSSFGSVHTKVTTRGVYKNGISPDNTYIVSNIDSLLLRTWDFHAKLNMMSFERGAYQTNAACSFCSRKANADVARNKPSEMLSGLMLSLSVHLEQSAPSQLEPNQHKTAQPLPPQHLPHLLVPLPAVATWHPARSLAPQACPPTNALPQLPAKYNVQTMFQ